MWTASKLNDHAISLMKKGFVEDAILTTKKAIRLLKNSGQDIDERKATALEPMCKDEDAMDIAADPMFGVVRLYPHTQCSSAFHHHTCDEDDNEDCREEDEMDDLPMHANNFNVYSRSFVFNTELSRAHKTDAAAMLLFNLGLCNHLYGLHCASGSSNKLKTALHLYKLAMATLQQQLHQPHASNNAIRSPLLTMALLTNMGHIQSHFLQRQQAKECLEGLEHCLADPENVSLLAEEEYRFFYFHLTCNRVCQSVVAPAA